MITAGKIIDINISSGEHVNNKCKVELNIFQIPGDTNKNTYTFEANCMVPPGFSALYNIGDIVYVGFLNNDKSFPIILGKIYQGLSEEYAGYGALQDLKIKNSADLPNNTKLGDYTYKQIDNYFKTINLIDLNKYVLKEDFDALKDDFDKLKEDFNSLANQIDDLSKDLSIALYKISGLESLINAPTS